jgi:hypothetical protein
MSDAPKPTIQIGRGSGQPAGLPDDWEPLNPWGRGFPKELLNKPPRPPLYQVIVRDARNGNKELRIGPKGPKENAEMLCFEISRMIASGAEKQWFDPIVLEVPKALE